MENIMGNRSFQVNYNDIALNPDVLWYGGYKGEPRDIPECGFEEICEGTDWRLTIIMCCVAGAIFVCSMAYRWYKTQKYEIDVNSKDSFLRFKDLATSIIVPHASIEEIIVEKGEMNPSTGVYRLNVMYEGKSLMLKKLTKNDVFVDRKVLMELKHLRDLRHQNINSFRGVTTLSPNICVLHDYNPKGSLYDILFNEDVQLDWDFKHTFISDIACGMYAIHESPIMFHGHLTSKNCLINHRWVIEIGDFGLTEFCKKDERQIKPSIEDEHKRCADLLWTSPENLTLPVTSSKAGDVYSFGVIVSEIINRLPPYSERKEMQSHEIIHYVRKRCIPPFRPHVSLKIGLDNRLVNLMKSCWSESPEDRPTFRQIKPTAKQIRGNKVEIIDNMISMMEQYTG